MLAQPQQEVDWRSDNLLSDQELYITRRILIFSTISYKQCPNSYRALFLSNMHLHQFYSLVNYYHYPLLLPTIPQLFDKLI